MIGHTDHDVTFQEAEEAVKQLIVVPTKPYIIEPICTKEQWDNGYINFCPRCGTRLFELEEPPYASFTCSECEAELEIYIQVRYDDE